MAKGEAHDGGVWDRISAVHRELLECSRILWEGDYSAAACHLDIAAAHIHLALFAPPNRHKRRND